MRVFTLNLHKGRSFLTREVVVDRLRTLLKRIDADIVFLQEVVGENRRVRSKRWPKDPQHTFLSQGAWEFSAYGKNAVYAHGHHGNAILSRYPILSWHNLDISESHLENRGLLHAQIDVDGEVAHAVCVHLGLIRKWRKSQLDSIIAFLRKNVPRNAPVVMAGDFNDFSNDAENLLLDHLHLTQAICPEDKKPIKTYPAFLPLFSIDRVYARGFEVQAAKRVRLGRGLRSTDHAGVVAELLRE